MSDFDTDRDFGDETDWWEFEDTPYAWDQELDDDIEWDSEDDDEDIEYSGGGR